MNMFKTTVAAAALMALPFAASALTVLPAESISLDPNAYSFSYTVEASDNGVEFQFTIADDLEIPQFSLSSSAPTGGSTTTLYQITDPDTGPASFGILNLATVGADVVPGATYAAGDTFSVIFREGSPEPISYTVSFGTVSTSEVPVPAAGLLLMTALGGAAAMRRRKKA